MTMRDAPERAMGPAADDPASRLRAEGLAVVSEEDLCRVLHEVFCGQLADHQSPNDKDREEARALFSALQMTAADQMTL